MLLCPCKSGVPYTSCCESFHKGVVPPTALQLMRSRYSAYALHLTYYIIETTHPNNPSFTHDRKKWSDSIEDFSTHTQFVGLDILDFQEQSDREATVTFRARLIQNGKDATFIEKSRFQKIDGRWLYRKAEDVTTRGKLAL